MKLGILVTTDNHLDHVIGLVKAGVAKGHTLSLFCMDRGTRLVTDTRFFGLCQLEGVKISMCQHSAEDQGVETGSLSKDIVSGSQFNNAMMNHDADKVIVL